MAGGTARLTAAALSRPGRDARRVRILRTVQEGRPAVAVRKTRTLPGGALVPVRFRP